MTDTDRAEIERIRRIAIQTVREAHAIATAGIDRMTALADLALAENALLLEIVIACGDKRTIAAVLEHLRVQADRFAEFSPRERVH